MKRWTRRFFFLSWAQLSSPSRETIGSPTEQGLPVPHFKKGPAAKSANTKCFVFCSCKFVWTTKTSIAETWCMGDMDPILWFTTSLPAWWRCCQGPVQIHLPKRKIIWFSLHKRCLFRGTGFFLPHRPDWYVWLNLSNVDSLCSASSVAEACL